VPELPEVETTRRHIGPLLLGRKISALHTTANSYFFLTPPAALARGLEGATIQSLERRGKYLLAETDRGEAHSVRLLSATARAALSPEDQPRFEPDEHTHVRFEFVDGGPEVYFRDVRKFGKLQLLAAGEPNPRIERLGEDALLLGGERLFQATRKRRTSIKALLLDQSVVAGVGNIYADEALFHAGVRPGRRAARVTRRECDAVADAVVRVLERSIETGGSSISDYVAPDGSDGGFQDERRVYSRTGEPCYHCTAPIRHKVVAQRSTHYCPNCQK